KGLLVDLSVGEFPEDFLAAERVIEEVVPGNGRALGVAPGINLKGDGAADHAVVFEQARGGAAGGPVGNMNEDAFRRKGSEGLFDAIPEVASHGARCQQCE